LGLGWLSASLAANGVPLVVPWFASRCRCREKPVYTMRIKLIASPGMALAGLPAQRQAPLLEMGSLPSANCFAECQKSGTRQRIALGKEFFAECRALGKKRLSAKDFFAECQTLGKSTALGIGCPM